MEHSLIEDEIAPYKKGNRTPAAALLAWFLETVWRVEPEDVDDAICDGPGDKGIDGLLVDHFGITVLQSKHRAAPGAVQGDRYLRQLVGAGAYFESPDSVNRLLQAGPNPELKRLLTRLEVQDRVAEGSHTTRLVFVTNGTLDSSGRGYALTAAGRQWPLDVWDLPRLTPVAQRTRRPSLLPDKLVLSTVSPPTVIEQDGRVHLAVGFVLASDLVNLPGIEDLSLFDRNVRLSEGRTRINRELAETIEKPEEHGIFPAFHNGLTLLSHGLKVGPREIHLNGVTVVNGCQSLLTLFEHRAAVTAELRLLVKVAHVERQSDLADKITYRSNNQNPVDIRDQRSTDRIQRDLQAEVGQRYGSMLGYTIRQGERLTAPEVLDNKTAAQFLMAVYLREPWNAVRKVRLFDDDYRRIFNRTVNAHKLFLIQQFVKVVDDVHVRLGPEAAASFATIRLTVAHLLSQVLRQSSLGEGLLEAPERWLPDLQDTVRGALAQVAGEVVDSVNFYIEEERREGGEDFDPKVVFKSQRGVNAVENVVLRFSRRLARRDQEYLFEVPPVR